MASRDSTSHQPARDLSGRWTWVVFAVMAVGSTLFRLHMFATGRMGLDADMADAGIGALRLIHEGWHSVFVPGQNYNGDLYSYYFVPLHLVFPPCVSVMQIGMLPLALLIGLSSFLAIRSLMGSQIWALTAAALLLFPPSMVNVWVLHSGSLYIIMLICFQFAIVLLLGVIRTVDSDGWSARNQIRMLLFGFLFGLSYWAHFSTLILMAATVVTLLVFPRIALRLAGILSSQPEMCGRGLFALSTALQIAMIAAACSLTHTLITGVGSGARSLPVMSAVIGGLLGSRIVLALASPPMRGRAPAHLSPLLAPIGLILGALPVVWHIHAQGRPIVNVQGLVANWDQFVQQLRSVFEVGIPVLLGLHHDYMFPTHRIPLWCKHAVLGLGLFGLAGLVVWSGVARLRGSRSALGLAWVSAVLVLQILIFSLSQHGWFVSNPRYLLPVYWAHAVAMGGLVHLLLQIPLRSLRWIAALPLVGLLAFNLVSCLDLPKREIVAWTGETTANRALIDHLIESDIRRVSCRFDPNGHWNAIPLTYIAREEVIFASSADDRIRSPRHLAMVDKFTADLAYLLLNDEQAERMGRFLTGAGSTFMRDDIAHYAVFHHVEPDILHDMTREEYLESVGQP